MTHVLPTFWPGGPKVPLFWGSDPRTFTRGEPMVGQFMPDTANSLSAAYFALSRLFSAHKTMLGHAILERETLPDDGSYSGSNEKRDDRRVDGARVDIQ
jgi:hypothetical protein